MSYNPNLHTDLLELMGEVPTEVLVSKVREAGLLGGQGIIELQAKLAFNALCAEQAGLTNPLDRKRFEAILYLIMALGDYNPPTMTFGVKSAGS